MGATLTMVWTSTFCSILLLQIASTSTTWAQDTTLATEGTQWGGCIDTLGGPAGFAQISLRQTICLVFGDGGDWSSGVRYLRTSFQPTVDEYTRFHIPNSYRDLIQTPVTKIYDGDANDGESKEISIHVEVQKVLSFQRLYYNNTNGVSKQGKIFPYLTAIIDVKDGEVVGITWDDACLFCPVGQCAENTYDYSGKEGTSDVFKQPTKGCYIEEATCDEKAAAGGTDCDVTLYVVWTGTDQKGNHLQSSASRYSQFPIQELQNRVGYNLPTLPSIPSPL